MLKTIEFSLRLLIPLLFVTSIKAQERPEYFIGGTMTFAHHLMKECGATYKQEGIPTDPFLTMSAYGANTIRLSYYLPPYENEFSQGYPQPDFTSISEVIAQIASARRFNLKVILTFGYKSWALNSKDIRNDYVAPLNWQAVATRIDMLRDSVYNHTKLALDTLAKLNLMPDMVTLGNETNWHIMLANYHQDSLPQYDPARTIFLLAAGAKAVRDISSEYKIDTQIGIHLFNASRLSFWLDLHRAYELDYDFIGLSHYEGWHQLDRNYKNWGTFIEAVKEKYNKPILILETAQNFTLGQNDLGTNILGRTNLVDSLQKDFSPSYQRQYLFSFAKEILDNGGLGLITWGTEWIGNDCVIYPNKWAPGSSWEEKTYWDFDGNVHEGINWMKDIQDWIKH